MIIFTSRSETVLQKMSISYVTLKKIILFILLFSDLCVDKFKCGNGKCIDMDLVCDKHHEDNCGDWSDEYCVVLLPSTAESKKGKNVMWIHDMKLYF